MLQLELCCAADVHHHGALHPQFNTLLYSTQYCTILAICNNATQYIQILYHIVMHITQYCNVTIL